MSKKHHYVPRSVLKNFAAGRKHTQVYVFDKVRQSAYQSSLMDAGSENHFNTLVIGGKTINFEDAFQGCDGKLAELSRRLVEKQSLAGLSQRDRADLANLAAIQFLRVKIVRTTLQAFPQMLHAVLSKRGPIAPELEAELTSFDENKARAMSLKMLEEAGQHAKHFLEKDWALMVAPSASPFWTSDNPIVIGNVFPYGERGLAAPGVELCWPLGSHTLLAFRCPTIANKAELVSKAYADRLRSGLTATCSVENVDYYNSLQIFQSSRFLYASTNEFKLARRAIKEYPDVSAERTSTFAMGGMGEAVSNSNMPMGRWLVAFGAKTHHMCRIDSVLRDDSEVVVEVADDAAIAIERALQDAPYSQVLIYQDQVPIHMMREAAIERVSNNPKAVQVYPRDPGLRKLFTRTAKSESGQSPTDQPPAQ